jgi:hypothetical protein
VSVVRRDTYRRWAVVGVAIAVLCALPSVVSAFPVHTAAIAPAALRARMLASADHPYQGYLETEGRLNLPQLPQLGTISSLLSGSTKIRTWFAAPDEWRTDVLTDTGEQDTYGTQVGTLSWDFETGQVTQILGEPAVRLPRADDLTPPNLAQRLLHTAAGDDKLVPLPARDVAGIAAPGLEIRPASPDTTIARVDIWADPATGVPLDAEVYGRASSGPVITSRFLDFSAARPADSAAQFDIPDGVPIATARSSDINSLLDTRARFPLPAELAGQAAKPVLDGYSADVSGYGSGFATFAVLFLGDRIGDSALSAATQAGAAPVTFPNGAGRLIRTPLLSVLLVRSDRFDRIFLLVGLTGPDLLTKAATDLLADVDNRFERCRALVRQQPLPPLPPDCRSVPAPANPQPATGGNP